MAQDQKAVPGSLSYGAIQPWGECMKAPSFVPKPKASQVMLGCGAEEAQSNGSLYAGRGGLPEVTLLLLARLSKYSEAVRR
jgi:hypothetical protein